MNFSEDLPREYPNWIRLFLEIDKHCPNEDQLITFEENNSENIFRYKNRSTINEKDLIKKFHYDKKFIRMKAFNEMLEVYGTFSNIDLSHILNVAEENFSRLRMEETSVYNKFRELKKSILK